jgi:hypothetical protein
MSSESGVESHWLTWLDAPLEYLHAFMHLDDFVRGVIDTRPFVYYSSLAALFLGLSVLVVEARA